MPTLRHLCLLIGMALSNVNHKPAPLTAEAFQPSMPAPRFAQTRDLQLSMQDFGLERKAYTTQDIQTFQAGIEALELPPLIVPKHGVSLSPHLLGTYAATRADIYRGAPSAHELSDFLHMHAASTHEPPQDTEPLKKPVVVLSSQINVCDPGVSERQRELVHSFLSLAQLAARESSPDGGDALGTPFWNFLLENGWLQLGNTEIKTQVLDMNASLNDQIVPILTDAFICIPGTTPVAGAASKIVKILRGLNAMELTSSWMALLRRSSIRQYGADFQFSTTSMISKTDDDTIVLDLVNVAFDAGRSTTRVMFFTFESTNAKLEITKQKLCITPELLESLGTTLMEKVRPYVPSEVMSIENAYGAAV